MRSTNMAFFYLSYNKFMPAPSLILSSINEGGQLLTKGKLILSSINEGGPDVFLGPCCALLF